MREGRQAMKGGSTKSQFMDRRNEFEADLLALAEMRDDEIDTSGIQESRSFDSTQIGRYSDISVRGYDVRSIANWCIARAKREKVTVTKMWLNKIVYFIYERALIDIKVLLTPARLEAWEYGPVFREIYLSFPKKFDFTYYQRYNVKKRQSEEARDEFECEDLRIFDQVWLEFGHLTASKLTNISHKPGSPWSRIWTYRGKANPGMVIDIETILSDGVGHNHGKD